MKILILPILLTFVMFTQGQQEWKSYVLQTELEKANKNTLGLRYEVMYVQKGKNKWVAYYKLVQEYYCYFCGEYNCPAEKCRQDKGVKFKLIGKDTLQAIYKGEKVSEWEIDICSLYISDDEEKREKASKRTFKVQF